MVYSAVRKLSIMTTPLVFDDNYAFLTNAYPLMARR